MCHGGELITEQTMVTHHGHTIAEYGQTWSAIKNHDTMVKLLPGFALFARKMHVNECSLARGPQIFAVARMLAFL